MLSTSDFLDLGSRAAVDQALSRSTRAGLLRKVARGLYDLPRVDPVFGAAASSADEVAKALARRDGVRIQPSGAHAANILGLSTQVPVRTVFLTDGPSKTVSLGKRKVVLKHVSSRSMATAGSLSGVVIHALLWIGRRGVDDAAITTLRRRLNEADKKRLLKDIRYAPAWVAERMRQIAGDR